MFVINKYKSQFFIPGKSGAVKAHQLIPYFRDENLNVRVYDQDDFDCTLETLSSIIFDIYSTNRHKLFNDMKSHLETILGEDTLLDIIRLGGLENYAIRLKKGLN